MPDIARLIRSSSGLAPTHRMLSAGVSPAALAWSVHSGTVVRVRKGWYCLPATPEPFQQAARIGGRLTGPTAAASAGIWSPPTTSFHVAVPANACRLRDRENFRERLSRQLPNQVVVHWTDDREGPSPFIRPIVGWLHDSILTQPLPWAVAMADSALHSGQMDPLDWEVFRKRLPGSLSSALAIVDGYPDTGTESILRWELAMAGVVARSRAVVSDGKEVDLLVGDRLVIEVDSERHHGSRENRLRDLARDAELAAIGYIVLRFDYVHVMYRMELIIEAVLAHVRAGEHLANRWS